MKTLIETIDQKTIEALRARFRADGVTETEYSADGPARVQVLDPDGYRVEVYAY